MIDNKFKDVRASSAERWMNCPGSIQLCRGLKKQAPNPAAKRGTALHEEAANFLRERFKRYPSPYVPIINALGDIHCTYSIGDAWRFSSIDPTNFKDLLSAMSVLSGWVCSSSWENINPAIKNYLKFIKSVVMEPDIENISGFHYEPSIEKSFKYGILSGSPDFLMYGDFSFLDEWEGPTELQTCCIHIVDLKTGRYPISAKNNSQLLCYAILVLVNEKDSIFLNKSRGLKTRLSIFQNETLSSVSISKDELIDFKTELDEALNLIKQDTTQRKAGKWCSFCPAKPICKEYIKELMG